MDSSLVGFRAFWACKVWFLAFHGVSRASVFRFWSFWYRIWLKNHFSVYFSLFRIMSSSKHGTLELSGMQSRILGLLVANIAKKYCSVHSRVICWNWSQILGLIVANLCQKSDPKQQLAAASMDGGFSNSVEFRGILGFLVAKYAKYLCTVITFLLNASKKGQTGPNWCFTNLLSAGSEQRGFQNSVSDFKLFGAKFCQKSAKLIALSLLNLSKIS